MLNFKYLEFEIIKCGLILGRINGGNMSNLLEIVKTRRSANKFVEGVKIPQEDYDKIFKELSLAPSAFNLQHAKYYVVEEKGMKEAMYLASHKQHKVKTASSVIVVTGNKKAYKDADKIYEGTLMLGILQKFEYNYMLDMINNLYDGWGETFQHDEAVRNASLSSMLFMLLAKNEGWDTCPMIYFKPEKVQELLGLTKDEVPVLMITMGKADNSSTKIRGFRKPARDYVTYI